MFTTNFTTNSPQQLAPSCPILPRVQQKYTFYKSLETLAKQGIPGQNKEKQNNDKNTFHLPRQYMSVTDFRICFKGHGGETRFN